MDYTSWFIGLIIKWITTAFPSTSQYAEYIAPGFMIFVTALGIFTNFLPQPGHKYPVPDTTALEAELQGSGGLILRIAKFTRSLSIGLNWFLATGLYAGFYKSTNLVSLVLSKVKLAPKPVPSSKTPDASQNK